MADQITSIDVQRVTEALDAVTQRVDRAARVGGRTAADVTIVAATKYLSTDAMGLLAQAGIGVVGENRAEALVEKVARHGDAFAWEFIGHLQSRKVRAVVPLARRLHAVSTVSVLEQLGKFAPTRTSDIEVLIEVNVADDPAKAGITPERLGWFLDQAREIASVRCTGLMTMPPHTTDAETSRQWFAALAELAAIHGLAELSMGTTQDFEVAVEEGATLIRLGSVLFS